MIPTPTPAAKMAVRAAAFAIRMALETVKKYGLAQRENTRISNAQRTKIPRSRMKMSHRMPVESLSAGAAGGA